MKAWLHEGEESWLHETTGDPVVTGYGGGTWEIVFPTAHGPLEVFIEPGDPCEIDYDELRAALERARLAREATA